MNLGYFPKFNGLSYNSHPLGFYINRITQREGGHDIPEKVIKRRYYSGSKKFV
jgi:predicted ABC-type ATPase